MPVLVAALGPALLRVAGELADGTLAVRRETVRVLGALARESSLRPPPP